MPRPSCCPILPPTPRLSPPRWPWFSRSATAWRRSDWLRARRTPPWPAYSPPFWTLCGLRAFAGGSRSEGIGDDVASVLELVGFANHGQYFALELERPGRLPHVLLEAAMPGSVFVWPEGRGPIGRDGG